MERTTGRSVSVRLPAFRHSRPRRAICMRLRTKRQRSLHSSSLGRRLASRDIPLSARSPLKAEAAGNTSHPPTTAVVIWALTRGNESSIPAFPVKDAGVDVDRKPATAHTRSGCCTVRCKVFACLPMLRSSNTHATSLHPHHCGPIIVFALFRHSGAFQATSSLRRVPLCP